jgi:copper resistance protein B
MNKNFMMCAALTLGLLPGVVSAQSADHSGHGAPDEVNTIGIAPAPPPPEDHAADALFEPARMADARETLRGENGDVKSWAAAIHRAEYQVRDGRDGYHVAGEAWFGGDINRAVISAEAEGAFGEPVEEVELQAVWSRAISPFWDLHLGVRHDAAPNPSRTHAVLGFAGTAPLWIEVAGHLFLSDKGEVRARIVVSHEARITQRLILEPGAELNFASETMPDLGIGSGLSDFELSAHLKYEVTPDLAPYVGVQWNRMTGETARMARLAGESVGETRLLAGLALSF